MIVRLASESITNPDEIASKENEELVKICGVLVVDDAQVNSLVSWCVLVR